MFSGLLFDARDGGPIHSVNKGAKRGGGPSLVSYKAAQGVKGSKYVSFPRAAFEGATLKRLREINPAEVMPDGSAAANRVSALRGRELELEAQVEKLKAELIKGDEIAPLVEVLRTVEADRQRVVEELAVARREAASPLVTALGDCATLADALVTADNPAEMRTRLRAALRRAVAGIWCLFVDRGPVRLAAVQIRFAGNDSERAFLIWHKRGYGNAAEKRAATWGVLSAPMEPGALDLRDAKDVAKLEKELVKLDLSVICGSET